MNRCKRVAKMYQIRKRTPAKSGRRKLALNPFAGMDAGKIRELFRLVMGMGPFVHRKPKDGGSTNRQYLG